MKQEILKLPIKPLSINLLSLNFPKIEEKHEGKQLKSVNVYILKIKSILTNKTHVELKLVEEILKWKVKNKKLQRADLHWAFDLGLRENIKQVVTTTGWPPGDGMDWQVGSK